MTTSWHIRWFIISLKPPNNSCSHWYYWYYLVVQLSGGRKVDVTHWLLPPVAFTLASVPAVGHVENGWRWPFSKLSIWCSLVLHGVDNLSWFSSELLLTWKNSTWIYIQFTHPKYKKDKVFTLIRKSNKSN